MARSRLVAAVVLAVAAYVSTTVPALAEGTWPASVQLATPAAVPGDTVSFSGQGPVGVGSGTCVVVLDGTVPPGADCSWDETGAISGAFAVPADAAAGTAAAVSVCWPGCYDDSLDDVNRGYWQANTGLKIVAPVADVPDVRCLPEGDATAQLKEAGFSVRVDREMGDVVTDQEPRPPAQLPQTGPIALFMRGVLVPDLVGSTYDDAQVTLEESCLAISAVDGITDGTVEGQDPGVDSVVPGGTTVIVTMSGSTTPATPTPPTPTPPTPTPPTPVTNGPDAEPGPVSFPVTGTAPALALLVAVLLVLLFAAGLLARAIHRHRGAAWVTAQVTVALRPGPAATFATRPSDERNHDHDHIITVVPVEVRHSITVEGGSA